MNDRPIGAGVDRFDALLPPEMASRAEQVGVDKTSLDAASTLALALLAGAFISLGAVFATVSTAGSTLDFGLTRLLGGLSFCLGLILVIGAGAELFTGNSLIVMAWAGRRVTTGQLLRNWGLVYLGNVIGSVATAYLVLRSGHLELGDGAVGDQALATADAKVRLGWTEAGLRGVLANALVCLAVWLSFSARSLADRILAVIFPITAFVAAGFEHSIANLYFVPVAIFATQSDGIGYWDVAGSSPADHTGLTWSKFVTDNLVPVTIGNIIGGAGLVAAVYWFIYLRHRRENPARGGI